MGDDGRFHERTDSIEEADEAARKLSTDGWLHLAQVVDFQTGRRDSWRNGIRQHGGIAR